MVRCRIVPLHTRSHLISRAVLIPRLPAHVVTVFQHRRVRSGDACRPHCSQEALNCGMFLYRVCGSAGRCRQPIATRAIEALTRTFSIMCFVAFSHHDSDDVAMPTAGCVLVGCSLSFGCESAVSGRTGHRPNIFGYDQSAIQTRTKASWFPFPPGLHLPDTNACRFAGIMSSARTHNPVSHCAAIP